MFRYDTDDIRPFLYCDCGMAYPNPVFRPKKTEWKHDHKFYYDRKRTVD